MIANIAIHLHFIKNVIFKTCIPHVTGWVEKTWEPSVNILWSHYDISVFYFVSNFEGIVRCVAELYAALSLDTRAKKCVEWESNLQPIEFTNTIAITSRCHIIIAMISVWNSGDSNLGYGSVHNLNIFDPLSG